MSPSFYNVIRTLYIAIIFLGFQHNPIVQCDDFFDNILPSDAPTVQEFFADSPEEIFNKLDLFFAGVTHFSSSLPATCIADRGWVDSNQYFMRFNPVVRYLLRGRLLIGSMNKLNPITTVLLTFYDNNDNIIQDNNGQPLQYTSTPQDLGNFLDFGSNTFNFAYAKFLFKLTSNVNFDENSIYFHFEQLSSSTTSTSTLTTAICNITACPTITCPTISTPMNTSILTTETTSTTTTTSATTSTSTSTTTLTTTSPATITWTTTWSGFGSGTINGPSQVFVDFNVQIYNVSMPCPSNAFCMWTLDNISTIVSANTSLGFTFSSNEIGNHTLSYVAIFNGNYIPLASQSINVKPLIDTAVLFYPNANSTHGVWNTVAGGNSTLSSPGAGPGNYDPQEIPDYVFDRTNGSKYTSFGSCNNSVSSAAAGCGLDTGFYIVLRSYPSLLIAFDFRTAIDYPEADPLSITIEGSNQNPSALLLGSSWTLIYNGTTGLDSDPGRSSTGIRQSIPNNFLWFKNYRFLTVTKRNSSNAVQYTEVELYGYYYQH